MLEAREAGQDTTAELEAALEFALEAQAVSPGELLDLVVWESLHMGREGFDIVWRIGLPALPALLRLRRDRHVHSMVPYVVVQELELRREMPAEEAEEWRRELARLLANCSAEHAPYYHGLLAGLGQLEHLAPALSALSSPLVADQALAHHLIETLVPTAALSAPDVLNRAIQEAAGLADDDDPEPLEEERLERLNVQAREWLDRNLKHLQWDAVTRQYVVEPR